jgi:antitoxin HicB
MTSYYATFETDGVGFLVTFPDVPEAISGGADRDEAMANAQDALEVALLTYVGDGNALPIAKTKQGVLVPLSAGTAVKIAFVDAFRSSGLTRVALAERLGKQEGEVRRMLDPYHRTKLAAMEAGLNALGKQLVVTVRNAA